jgi:hypothetical protein
MYKSMGISYYTMMKYAGCKESTIREVGHGIGSNCLIEYKNQKFLADVMARKDSSNEGLTMIEGVDLVQEVLPHLYRSQTQQSFVRTVC